MGFMLAVKQINKKKRAAEEIQNNALNEELLVALIVKRRREAEEEEKMPHLKRSFIFYDHERAKYDVYHNYFSPTCHYNDKQFERCFRITKGMAEMILLECGNSNVFFTNTKDALKKVSICPKVKLLMGLKLLSFGSAAPAMIEYFKMGLVTARLCLLNIIICITESELLRSKFMRKMTRADAERVATLHHNQHGIDGMIGSIDCMHVFWKNCPVAWQGQYKGKEKKPSMVLEAMCDYQLWIWHAAFGYAGSQNDINIFDQSPLLESFIDGTFSVFVDFEYTINDEVFTKLFMLADGIYPQLSRIVKTVDEPRGLGKKLYAKWQESCRKDIERAFGVLQRKFQILKRPIEQWFPTDITRIVESTIILHNMMVEHRINKGEKEDCSFYEIQDDERVNNVPIDYDEATDNIQQQNARLAINHRLEDTYYNGSVMRQESLPEFVTEHIQICNERFRSLYDTPAHLNLQRAIIEQLLKNQKEKEKNKNNK